MNPRPDHGENSYKGSGRLAARKALITGGDSGMGRAAAIAFAREGADVALNYFPTEEPDAREGARDLASNKSLSSAFGFMVEQNSIAGVYSISFAIIHSDPMREKLGDAVR